jgi:hypothetical protein
MLGEGQSDTDDVNDDDGGDFAGGFHNDDSYDVGGPGYDDDHSGVAVDADGRDGDKMSARGSSVNMALEGMFGANGNTSITFEELCKRHIVRASDALQRCTVLHLVSDAASAVVHLCCRVSRAIGCTPVSAGGVRPGSGAVRH